LNSETLSGKIALITGANRGIGHAIALELAQSGATVVLTARDKDKLDRTREEIVRLGGKGFTYAADLCDAHAIHQLAERCKRDVGPIDILVNNAGLGTFSDVASMALEDFDTMWNVNVRAVAILTKAVLPAMIARKSGDIINIASLAGKNAIAGGAGYAATKWALLGFSKSLMLEVRKHNIRVVTICPGSVNTEFADHSADGDQIIQPQDVADAVLTALISPRRTNISEIDIRPTVPPRK
jgi:3-oxoacyl-[acyl-carrier protein] reductase